MSDLISRDAAAKASEIGINAAYQSRRNMSNNGGFNAFMAAKEASVAAIRALPAAPAPDVAGAARVLLDNPLTLHAASSAAMPSCYGPEILAALRQIAGGDGK